MGLDLVEMVMAIEERFGITLSDAEASSATTPGQLIDLIFSKVGVPGPRQCMTGHAFYGLRRALMKEFHWDRSQIAPATRLEELVPRSGRQEAWERLREDLQAHKWPELKRPRWMRVGLGILFVGMCLLLAVNFRLRGLSPWWGLTLALGIWAFGVLLTKPFCREIPRAQATVGQLSEFLVAYAPRLFEPEGRRWTRADVADAVRQITIEELGIKPEQYREDAGFVQDLGAS